MNFSTIITFITTFISYAVFGYQYEEQSGNYAKMKAGARDKRKKAVLDRKKSTLYDKKRSSKNSHDTSGLDVAIKATEDSKKNTKKKKVYDNHSGEDYSPLYDKMYKSQYYAEQSGFYDRDTYDFDHEDAKYNHMNLFYWMITITLRLPHIIGYLIENRYLPMMRKVWDIEIYKFAIKLTDYHNYGKFKLISDIFRYFVISWKLTLRYYMQSFYMMMRLNHINRSERKILDEFDSPFTFRDKLRLNFSAVTMLKSCSMTNVENIMNLFVGLVTSTNFINASTLLVAHFKIYYKESIVLSVLKSCKNLFEPNSYEEQSSGDMLTQLKYVLSDWKKLKDSLFVKRVLDILALVTSSSLCGSMNLDFNVAGISLFSEGLKGKIASLNILDASQLVIEAVAYFMEIGYVCFTQKSLRPILYTDVESYNYDKKYIEWVTHHSAAEDGDWKSIGINSEEFESLYDDLRSYLGTLHATMSKGVEKTIIFNRILNISKLKNSYDRKKNACSMRRAPYVMCYYGSSSVGKTSVASILNIVAVKACGGTGAAEQKVTYNENDDYFSSYKSDTETIVMDDLCNTKAQFLTSSPLHQLIKFNNNNPELAVMAGLEEKGKLAINAKTVVITTNVADLCAGVYSNEPVSILRRIDTYITVTVKKQFALHNGTGKSMLDSTKAAEYVAMLNDDEKLYPDLWNLTVSKLETLRNPVEGGPDSGRFVPVSFNGRVMEDVSLLEVARYVAQDAKRHDITQGRIVDGQSTLHRKINICPLCNRLSVDCICQVIEEQSGEEVPNEEKLNFTQWLAVDFFTTVNRTLRILMPFFSTSVIAAMAAWATLSFNFALRMAFWTNLFAILSYMLCLYTQFCGLVRGYRTVADTYDNIIQLRRDMIDNYNANTRGGMWARIAVRGLSAWAIARLIYAIIDTYRACRKVTYEDHSALNPNAQEYESRRNTPNYWAPIIPRKMHDGSIPSDTATWQQVDKRVEHNSVFVRQGKLISGGFMIKTHMLVVPNHFCIQDAIFEVTVREPVGNNSYKCYANVSLSKSYLIPQSDLRIFYFPSGGDFKDMTPYFPLRLPRGVLGSSFTYRQKTGIILKDKALLKFSNGIMAGLGYEGAKYTFKDLYTFKGLCMGVFVGETKSPKIVGFHLAGVTDTKMGASGVILRGDIDTATRVFDSVGSMIPAESAPMCSIAYVEHRGCVPFASDAITSPKCPTNFLDEGSNIRIFGSCEGGVSRASEVIVSHISDDVAELFGNERQHDVAPMGYPLVASWHNWQKGMQGFSKISIGPNTGLLARACEDFLTPLRMKMRQEKPLDMDTIINGKDGDKFLNRMPQNTSVGFPLSGPLSRFCHLKEAQDDHNTCFEVDESIQQEYMQLKTLYRRGVRSNSTFRASLKDEPVKIGKLKVRVFQAAPVALKMVLREYYLPIVSQLSMFPLLSECAVGINPFSCEWNEMHNHIVHFGDDNIVAGDYSAYDQRMSPALTSAAFSILIDLGRNMGYSDDDILIMRGAATDVVYPLVAYNGTLVQFLGSNPSGHNLTVYINSIANSLISRCAFFDIFKEDGYFRNYVRMMTYGDDDIGSVDSDYKMFNNITKSLYIDSIGMTYTPPSKEGEHMMFMSVGDVDFLKRKSTFNLDKQRWMGCLEVDSIMKSLHVRMRSKEISDAQWAASVCDAALREFYPAGEHAFVDAQKKLTILAERHDFAHHTQSLVLTYTEMGEKIG